MYYENVDRKYEKTVQNILTNKYVLVDFSARQHGVQYERPTALRDPERGSMGREAGRLQEAFLDRERR